ncbi:sulfurtransferase TusA family protein [Asticcacaulis sp. YBE204]|uniref:sulfurtransferase TusA family protein n=1 Tax=Asticcacaulis sp. YBE204 TaxID=1282363 RepID=UPI0012DFB923|nr:sulfurtransferase TusA family protein [Asticcacaulis sp. YBE204]
MKVDSASFVIDARGHRCPVPTLRLKKAMNERPEVAFVLLADDPMAQIDVPHFCNQNNYMLQSIELLNKFWRFKIQRNLTD